jgi:hypothetical protein
VWNLHSPDCSLHDIALVDAVTSATSAFSRVFHVERFVSAAYAAGRQTRLKREYGVDKKVWPPIEGVSRLVDITAGCDFLGLCDQNSSYKRMSDFGRLRSYGLF